MVQMRKWRPLLRLEEGTHQASYRKIAEGTFPAQVRISVHGAGWYESSINRWIADPAGYRAENDNPAIDDGPV